MSTVKKRAGSELKAWTLVGFEDCSEGLNCFFFSFLFFFFMKVDLDSLLNIHFRLLQTFELNFTVQFQL